MPIITAGFGAGLVYEHAALRHKTGSPGFTQAPAVSARQIFFDLFRQLKPAKQRFMAEFSEIYVLTAFLTAFEVTSVRMSADAAACEPAPRFDLPQSVTGRVAQALVPAAPGLIPALACEKPGLIAG